MTFDAPPEKVASSLRLAVTTGHHVDEARRRRAFVVAERLGVPCVPRASFAEMGQVTGVECFYVVRHTHEELRALDGRAAHVQPGMMPTKIGQGLAHPFVRAVRGAFGASARAWVRSRLYGASDAAAEGDGGVDDDDNDSGGDKEVGDIFDATLGLANDAVHLAAVLDARVQGCEASPVLFSLLEEGLVRIARSTAPWAEAASRVTATLGRAEAVLALMPSASVDVVVCDPMMSLRRRSAPSFELLRAFALSARATPLLLREAARVARRRVVLKLGKGAPLPVNRSIEFPRCLHGAHVTYWVHEKGRDVVFVDQQHLPCERFSRSDGDG
jgi:hypothetical protein